MTPTVNPVDLAVAGGDVDVLQLGSLPASEDHALNQFTLENPPADNNIDDFDWAQDMQTLLPDIENWG
jgi:hypothetical protein